MKLMKINISIMFVVLLIHTYDLQAAYSSEAGAVDSSASSEAGAVDSSFSSGAGAGSEPLIVKRRPRFVLVKKGTLQAASSGAGAGSSVDSPFWLKGQNLLDALRLQTPSSLPLDDAVHVKDPDLAAYFSRMDREGKPRVLIVGCGHFDKDVFKDVGNVSFISLLNGNHLHPDAWCMNARRDITGDSHEHETKDVKADQIGDIRDPHLPFPEGEFDIVVLELIMNQALNNGYTYYNAARALRTGGHLFIEIVKSYLVSPYLSVGQVAQEILYRLRPEYTAAAKALKDREDYISYMDEDKDKKDQCIANYKAMQHHYVKLTGPESMIVGRHMMPVLPVKFSPYDRYGIGWVLTDLLFSNGCFVDLWESPFSGRPSFFYIAQKTPLTEALLIPYSAEEVTRLAGEHGYKNPYGVYNANYTVEMGDSPWTTALKALYRGEHNELLDIKTMRPA